MDGICQIPGEQFFDALDGMLGDPGQHQAEIEFRVEAVELGGTEQRVDRGSSLAAGVGAAEKVILPSKRNGAQRAFSRRIVDLQEAIVDIARKRAPAREGVADGARSFALGGQGAEHLFQPASEIVEQGLGPCLSNTATQIGGLAANFFFDAIQSADAVESFGCDGRSMNCVDVVKLAPCVALIQSSG